MRMIGYGSDSQTYVLWDGSREVAVQARNVVFHKNTFDFQYELERNTEAPTAAADDDDDVGEEGMAAEEDDSIGEEDGEEAKAYQNLKDLLPQRKVTWRSTK